MPSRLSNAQLGQRTWTPYRHPMPQSPYKSISKKVRWYDNGHHYFLLCALFRTTLSIMHLSAQLCHYHISQPAHLWVTRALPLLERAMSLCQELALPGFFPAALSMAITMYRAMDMTFWLPQQRRRWHRQADQRGQREEFLEALPPRPAYGWTRGSADAPGTVALCCCGRRVSSFRPLIDTKVAVCRSSTVLGTLACVPCDTIA
jgi:hypothetical protein